MFLTKALVIERAGRAASVGYIQVAFAMVWQLLVFGEPPTAWTLAGACLILGGTLVVSQLTSELAGRLPVLRRWARIPTRRARPHRER